MTSTPASALPVGYDLHEYKIEKVLGVGAFGVTYRGFDTNLKAPVAIKEFFPSDLVSREGVNVVLKSAEDAELYQFGIDAFVSEAQVLAQFKHPNIVRVSRYFTANSTAYFVMDFEEGKSLGETMRAGKLDAQGLNDIFVDILTGLKTVHGKKYLHRDIKPGNIYIRSNGSPMLIDFGAARLEFGSSGQDGVCVLTPGYAPVEQYTAEGVQGPWSDLYALGATMYRCVTGKVPPESVKRMSAVRMNEPDPLMPVAKAASGNFSPAFLKAIDWALELRQEKRPQSADQLLNLLQGESRSSKSIASTFSYTPKRAVRNHKIIFAGPVGVGKTTAISVLSDTPVVATDQSASDMTKLRKGATTVAMDYGVMKMSETEKVHLYGTPGQERFDFMWDILQKGALGLVVLIDNSRKAPMDDLGFYLDAFQQLIKDTKVVIGVNFMENNPSPTLEDYFRFLQDEARPFRVNPPLFEVDTRSKTDMIFLIQSLLFSIDPGVQDYNV